VIFIINYNLIDMMSD